MSKIFNKSKARASGLDRCLKRREWKGCHKHDRSYGYNVVPRSLRNQPSLIFFWRTKAHVPENWWKMSTCINFFLKFWYLKRLTTFRPHAAAVPVLPGVSLGCHHCRWLRRWPSAGRPDGWGSSSSSWPKFYELINRQFWASVEFKWPWSTKLRKYHPSDLAKKILKGLF